MIKREEGDTLRRMRGKSQSADSAVNVALPWQGVPVLTVIINTMCFMGSLSSLHQCRIWRNKTFLQMAQKGFSDSAFSSSAPTALYSCYKLHSKTSREYWNQYIFFVVLNTQMNWVGHFIIYFLFILFSLFFFFLKCILLYYMLLLAIWLLWGAAAPLT